MTNGWVHLLRVNMCMPVDEGGLLRDSHIMLGTQWSPSNADCTKIPSARDSTSWPVLQPLAAPSLPTDTSLITQNASSDLCTSSPLPDAATCMSCLQLLCKEAKAVFAERIEAQRG